MILRERNDAVRFPPRGDNRCSFAVIVLLLLTPIGLGCKRNAAPLPTPATAPVAAPTALNPPSALPSTQPTTPLNSRASDETYVERGSPEPSLTDITSRSKSIFDRAVYLKPRADTPQSPLKTLAPLIAIRVPDGDIKLPPTSLPLAAYNVQREARQDERRNDPPTLYFHDDEDKIGTVVYPRKNYVWFLRDDMILLSVDSIAAPIPYTAVSLTLDHHGSPMIVRVRQDRPRADRYFVTEALENAAQKEFGPPLPGRTYSIEPAIDRLLNENLGQLARRIVAPQLLAASPEPSGPWVYVDGKDQLVTTVLCRCSPSQIKSFTETLEYNLLPLSEVPPFIAVPDLSEPSSAALRLPKAIP